MREPDRQRLHGPEPGHQEALARRLELGRDDPAQLGVRNLTPSHGRRVTRRSLVVAGSTSVAAIAVVSTALAAYESPRLQVTQVGNSVTIDMAQSPGDDATAIMRLISPLDTQIAAARAPGSDMGTARAVFVTAGGDVPAEGSIVVAGSGQIPAAQVSACAEGEPVEALWIVQLAGAGVALSVPLYLLGGGDLLACFPHPSTTGGAKLTSLELVLDGPLLLRAVGTWISIWVPYGSNALADTSRIVASPAVVGPGEVNFSVKARGAGAIVTGLVSQGGAPRAAARVRITGGPRATGHRVLGTATTNGAGRFTFRARSGTFFRATASVGRSSPPGICFVLEALLRPIPCVNPTLNGFSVQSRTIRKR
jgi:hypothetical protein